MKQKLLSLLLSLTLCLSLFPLSVVAALDETYQTIKIPAKDSTGAFEITLQAAYLKNVDIYMIDYNEGIFELDPETGEEIPKTVNIPVYFLKPGSKINYPSRYGYELLGPGNNEHDGAYFMQVGGEGSLLDYPAEHLFKDENSNLNFDLARLLGCDPETDEEYIVCYLAMGNGPLAPNTSNDCSDGHTPADAWISDATEHWHICAVCNEKVDSAAHTFGSWTTTKEATATAAGSRERTCTVCSYKQTETIPTTGGGSQGGSGTGGSSGGGGIVVPPVKDDKTKEEQPTTNAAEIYNDIPANAWYNDAVNFVTEKGLMSGTGADTFAPGDKLTRAMLAQILYNNEDKPATSGNAFDDVQSSAWYADAVTWATQKGIVSGYGNGQFGPNDNITREQLAVMLWRYAGQPASIASLNGFTDVGKASDYTLTALQWAVEKGIISGKGNGTIDPTGNATRAEVAQMLMNYFK